MKSNREEVESYIVKRLEIISQDWDDAIPITPSTLLFTELGFESLDAVVLGVTIQEHFAQQMPFSELFAELGEKRRDLSVSELIDFVSKSMVKQ